MQKITIAVLVCLVIVQWFFLFRPASPYPSLSVVDGTYIVEVVDDDLEDDSIAAVKYRLEVVVDEFGQRSVQHQTSSRKCLSGRWHQDFSMELCV